jgi:prepilin-type N-terminal cleavage/methylation domain-containing protein
VLHNNKLKKEGFTIIEVLIVLAIAGVILLIVFLAVPALQRNNRNTQRKNDVSVILGAVSEYASNNKGVLPTTAGDVDNLANTGYYTGGVGTGQGQITLTATAAQGALGETSANDRIVIVTGAKCGAAGATVGGSARQVAVQYLVEDTSADGFLATCQES